MTEHEFYAQPTIFDHWQRRSRSWLSEYVGHYRMFSWSIGFAVLALVCFMVVFSTSLSLLLDQWLADWNDSLARWLILCMAIASGGWLLQQALLSWPRQAGLPDILVFVARVAGWSRPPAPTPVKQGARHPALRGPEGTFVERRAVKRPSTAAARQIQAFYTGVRESGVNVTVAQSLFAAGIRSPHQVRMSSNEALLAIHGVGPVTVRKLRTRFG